MLRYVTAVESISGRRTCVGNVVHCFRLPSVWFYFFMFKEKYNQSSRQCVDVSPNTDELLTCRNKPCQVFKTEQQAKRLVTKVSMCFYLIMYSYCVLVSYVPIFFVSKASGYAIAAGKWSASFFCILILFILHTLSCSVYTVSRQLVTDHNGKWINQN